MPGPFHLGAGGPFKIRDAGPIALRPMGACIEVGQMIDLKPRSLQGPGHEHVVRMRRHRPPFGEELHIRTERWTIPFQGAVHRV